MKYESKRDLLADIEKEYEALAARLETLPRERVMEAGVWGDDWTIIDLVAHLAEWHAMLLGWYSEGLGGRKPDLPRNMRVGPTIR